MILFPGITKTFAIFYDSNGYYKGKKQIDTDQKTFNFQGSTFVYKPDCLSFLRVREFFIYKKYYFYHIDNPEPIQFKQEYNPVMTSQQFGILINTKKLQELNDLANEGGILEGLLKLLKNPIFWILLVVFIGLFIYLQKNGWKLW